MDKDLKAKWLAALRSGKYRQARERLCTADGAMCCLGVLCHIQGADVILLPQEQVPHGTRYAAGIGLTAMQRLASMNDSGKSFPEIADYIQQYF